MYKGINNKDRYSKVQKLTQFYNVSSQRNLLFTLDDKICILSQRLLIVYCVVHNIYRVQLEFELLAMLHWDTSIYYAHLHELQVVGICSQL